ncbi:MAG TPA: lysophospholipid acyltransferase family protein [Acidimicrobiales bacterium]|nr:lysophospholipid acyltransferase family protein [Acidimicrobiales bacterium]
MPVKPVTDTDATDTRHFTLGLPTAVYRALRSVAHAVNRGYLRVTVEGASVVPATGPVILAPVHRSNIDFLVASEVTTRKLFYMAKDTLWKRPRFGAFLESIGAFPVHREGADRLALDRAQDVLERGEALILFPEGTRRSGPVVEELHEGAAFLAARTGAPIIPIGIGGSAAAMPKGSKMIRPVKIHVVVGQPLQAPARSAKGRVPRTQVHALTEVLRAELQALYDMAQKRVEDTAGRRR